MKKIILAFLVLSSFALIGCTDNNNNSGEQSSSETSSQTSSSSSIIEKKVTVEFYMDYNQVLAGNVYFTTEVDNGSLITEKPANPTQSNYPEFPVFKGWSKKEIINDLSDLWNFETDIVICNSGTFKLYGIWMAQGEQYNPLK